MVDNPLCWIIAMAYWPPYPCLTKIHILIIIQRISIIAYHILKNGRGCGFLAEITCIIYIHIEEAKLDS
jgi:hypothetical protein